VKLTAKRVARALKHPGRYHDGHGLYLQVVGPNNASWLLRYERDGREHMLGLGPVHTVGLKEARERARAARLQLLDGLDPIAAKKADRVARALRAAKSITFKEAAEAFIAAKRDGWRNVKHAGQWDATLGAYVYPKIGELPVAEIDTGLVLKCIEPIWKDRTETASRVRGRIEAILDWATVRKYRQGDNPARWRGHLQHVLVGKSKIAKVEHHPALPYRDLPAFMAELRQRDGSGARALEFTVLTAARSGEAIGAQWGEIDLTTKLWTVPAVRMKAGKEHRVPLSDAAVALLQSLPTEEGNNFVFIGTRPGAGLGEVSLNAVLKRMGRGDVTVHGFRSSFRDWAAEQTNYAREVAEMALAHAIPDAVEAAYRRGDLLQKRFALAEAWSRFCSSPPVKADKTVVPMHAHGA
jgi:integrase